MLTQEQCMQKIIECSQAAIFLKDAEGRILMVNDAVAELLGASKEEIIGKTDYDFQSKEQADRMCANDQKVRESGKAMVFKESGQWKAGTRTYITQKFPVNTEEWPNAVGGIAINITELE